MWAHFRVQFMFNKYSKIKCTKNLNGLKSAEKVLEQNDVFDVSIKQIDGYFNDHFDPTKNKIFLSEPIYSKNSVTAIGVAAHEAGHAVQCAKNYGFLKMRQKLVPVTKICSGLSTPILLIGLMLPVRFNFLVNLGILLFSVAVFFELVTLPVEFDASGRAMAALQNSQYLTEEELKGAKKVLIAAAMTYVAALFTSLISLIRLIWISLSREEK
jgi:Zn-dependent membrane protease YugP